MMTPLHLSRRAALRGLLGCSLVGTAWMPRLLGGAPAPTDDLPNLLASFFTEKSSARVIGSAYLQQATQEAAVSVLLQGICGSQQAQWAVCARTTPARLRTLIHAQQRSDFEAGRIVSVQGWLLAVTEARLCALATLV